MSTNFEQSVATLAENRLAAEHSDLLPYRKGFVLFDFDEDAGTALGVYRFVIGNVQAMMPVVINKGSVDGMDILILRDLSLFVPAVDGWVSALASMGPRDLGELKESGTASKGAASVVLQFSRFPYALKTAEAALTAQEYAAFSSAFDTLDAKKATRAYEAKPLTDLLPRSALGCTVVAKTAESDPVFRECFVEQYGEPFLRQVQLKGATNPAFNLLHEAASEDDTPALHTIEDIADPAAKQLTSAEKRRLLKSGQFIVDHRAETETAEVYTTPQVQSLQTVSLPGAYQLLQSDGTFINGQVLADRTDHYPTWGDSPAPAEYGRNVDKVWFVPAGGGVPCRLDAQALWGKPGKASDDLGGDDASEATLTKYADKAKDTDGKNAGDYPVSASGEACTYFEVLAVANKAAVRLSITEKDGKFTVGDRAIAITPDFRSFRIAPATFFIPDKAKLFLLSIRYGESEGEPVLPGTPENVRLRIAQETGGTELTVNMRGEDVKISGGLEKTASSENEAIRALVYDAGIAAPAAVKLVGTAARASDHIVKVVWKKAEPLGPIDVTRINEKPTLMTEKPGSMEDLSKWTKETSRTADVATPDEFDKSLIDKVLTMTDFREVGLDQVRALTDAMDQCGKLLLRVLVHKDAYEDRYSVEDADRLETSCRKQFMGNGDVVLFLREKRGVGGSADDEVLVDLLTSDMAS